MRSPRLVSFRSVCPLRRALLLLVSSFIENNWKIDDSSYSGLFKEGAMELSLLLYCIPFVYSGQCSASSTYGPIQV